MIYEEKKEVTNADLLEYFAKRTKMLEGLVEKMSAELSQLRQEVQSMKQQVNYNGLLAKSASPILPEEDRKSAALEVLKFNEVNANRQLDPNGGFDNAIMR